MSVEIPNNYFCILVQSYFRKIGGKWTCYQSFTRAIEYDWYLNYINASPFFRSIGGLERQSHSYTSKGYIVTKVVSHNPDRSIKKIAEFKMFEDFTPEQLSELFD